MEYIRRSSQPIQLAWSLFLVFSAMMSDTVAFQDSLRQNHLQLLQRGRYKQKRCRIYSKRRNRRISSSFTIFADLGERTEVGDTDTGLDGGTFPTQKHRRVSFDPPSSISRRSAATSMATAVASVLLSINTIDPAIAAEDDLDVTTKITTIEDSKASNVGTLDTSMDDPPIAKEKTIVYSVQDFSVALPVNWRVITKYDEKASKPPSTPTLFSAIDFNSGAVISIVKEEACSVSEYARSSFEKSNKNTARKCDFALRNTSEEGTTPMLFSLETFEKDASKLLVRHDDRDNAVLRGVSKIEESMLTTKGGRRRRHSLSTSEQLSSSASDVASTTDSFSSALLELRATTTIPTSGTYRDTMGLEQPNTIERKVLAKAVAITTRVTQTPAERMPSPSAADSQLLATENSHAAATHEPTESKSIDPEEAIPSMSKEEIRITDSDLGVVTTTDPPDSVSLEATTATASTKDTSKTEPDDGASTVEKPPLKLTAGGDLDSDRSLSSKELTTTDPPDSVSSEATTATASTKDTSKTEPDDGTSTAEKPPLKLTAEGNIDSDRSLSQKDLIILPEEALTSTETISETTIGIQKDSLVAATTAPVTKTTEKDLDVGASTTFDKPIKSEHATKIGMPGDSTFRASTPDSPMTAMMAMVATTVEEPTTSSLDTGLPKDTILDTLSEDPKSSIPNTVERSVEIAIEKAQDKAIETVIERAKERAIEQAITTVEETAKETAKEVIQELLAETKDTSTAEVKSTGGPKHATTNKTDTDSEAAVGNNASSMDDAQTIEADMSIDTTEKINSSSPSDASLLASTAATKPGITNAAESLPGSTTTTMTSTSVLSIWLSAPLDEWQKPVMGTKLNQIWESVEYSDNIVEGSDGLALLNSDNDESSINTQLLLMNNKSIR